MHCIVYILFSYFILRIGCEPSGLKLGSVRNTQNDEYPFLVRMESRITFKFDDTITAENDLHLCTCAALRPTWSLTAGHCIDGASPTKDLTDNLKIQTVIRYGSTSSNSSTAAVTSTFLHPSFHDPLLNMQNDIGLLRTEPIQLKMFAVLSTVDINTLGGYEVTLAGHTNTNGSLRIGETYISVKRTPPQLINALVVRYDGKQESTLPTKCVANRCVTSSNDCDGDSGGPILHTSGVIGINTISLENIRQCSAANGNGLISMDIICPTRPHLKWINETILRDDVYEEKSSRMTN